MTDTGGPNRDYPLELVRLASAVTKFQCPIPGSRQLSFERAYKTSSAAHSETIACIKQVCALLALNEFTILPVVLSW